MGNYANPKLKLLYLKQFFEEMTDEDHPATMPQILAYLESKGIHAERKSIYADLDYLADYGMDVRKDDRGKSYQWVDRPFEKAELKLIIDSISSCKFLSESKCNALIKKVGNLGSDHQRRELNRQVKVLGRVKSTNMGILNNVDAIQAAMTAGKTITFKYFHYNVKKERDYRHDGALYEISPWALVYDNNFYYLIGCTNKEENRTYRVDRMSGVEQTDNDRKGKEFFEKFDMAAYSKATFGMFGNAEQEVEMVFHNSMMDAVIDKFGKDVWTSVVDQDHFRVTVSVAVSPQFYAWVFGLGNLVQIVSPPEVKKDFCQTMTEVLQKYAD